MSNNIPASSHITQFMSEQLASHKQKINNILDRTSQNESAIGNLYDMFWNIIIEIILFIFYILEMFMNRNTLQQSQFDTCKNAFLHVMDGTLTWCGSASFVDLSEFSNFSSEYDYILTAAHMIYDENYNIVENMYFHTISPTNTILNVNLSTDLVIYSIAADIAILRTAHVDGRHKLRLANSVKTSETLCCMGWTDAYDMQSAVFTNVKNASWSEGIPDYSVKLRTPVDCILVDNVTMMGGNSGGPWINSNNEIVAICSWGLSPDVISDVDTSLAYHIFGVSYRSIKALLGKFDGSMSFNYIGKTIGCNLCGNDLYNVLYSYPQNINDLGCFGYDMYNLPQELLDLGINEDAILIEINGVPMGQLEGFDTPSLHIFYNDSINCKIMLNAASGDTTITDITINLCDRTQEEQDMFVYLLKPIIKNNRTKSAKQISSKKIRQIKNC